MAPKDVFEKFFFFFLKKMKAMFKGGIILNMFRTFETGCSQRIIFT